MELIYRVSFKEPMGTSLLMGGEQYMALKAGKVSQIVISVVDHNQRGFDSVLISKKDASSKNTIEDSANWDYLIKDQWISFNPARVKSFYENVIKISFIVENDFFDSPETEKEAVNHPSHYNMGKFEVIDVIHDWKLGFNRGNAIKYLARAGHKDQAKYIEDLNKAIFYIKDEIKRHLDKEELKDIQKDLK